MARGLSDFVYLTVSTGIGAAVFARGAPLAGADGLAGELGHTPATEAGIRCGCGARGHLEALAGGDAMARIAEARLRRGYSGPLADYRRRTGRPLTAADLTQAADAGDLLARSILDRGRRAIAAAVIGFVNAFNPQAVIIGGSVAQAGGAAFIHLIRTAVDKGSFPTAARRVSIGLSALGVCVSNAILGKRSPPVCHICPNGG